MTEDQESKIKAKLRGSQKEQWYSLFKILLPGVRDEDLSKYTPCKS